MRTTVLVAIALSLWGCKGRQYKRDVRSLPPLHVEQFEQRESGCSETREVMADIEHRLLQALAEFGYKFSDDASETLTVRGNVTVEHCDAAAAGGKVELTFLSPEGGQLAFASSTFNWTPERVSMPGIMEQIKQSPRLRSYARTQHTATPPAAEARQQRLNPAWTVAVMPLESGDLAEAQTVRELQPQMRAFIAKLGPKTIPETNTDTDCHELACWVERGKSLNASHVLISHLARFGDQCSMTVEMVDLAQQLTVAASSARGACTPTALLSMAEECVGGFGVK